MLVGIDALDIVRVQKFIENERFLNKFFTDYEVKYITSTINKTMRMAGIFCAKEAFLKALGIGLKNGISLNEIEVNHDKNGKPFIILSENAKKLIKMMNITDVQISISHTHTTSYAVCICN